MLPTRLRGGLCLRVKQQPPAPVERISVGSLQMLLPSCSCQLHCLLVHGWQESADWWGETSASWLWTSSWHCQTLVKLQLHTEQRYLQVIAIIYREVRWRQKWRWRQKCSVLRWATALKVFLLCPRDLCWFMSQSVTHQPVWWAWFLKWGIRSPLSLKEAARAQPLFCRHKLTLFSAETIAPKHPETIFCLNVSSFL